MDTTHDGMIRPAWSPTTISDSYARKLSGLSQVIEPAVLREMQVPEHNELSTSQWTHLGFTLGVGLTGGALSGQVFAGKPLAGALVGLGGASLGAAIMPPLWLKIVRAGEAGSGAAVISEYTRPSATLRFALATFGLLTLGAGIVYAKK